MLDLSPILRPQPKEWAGDALTSRPVALSERTAKMQTKSIKTCTRCHESLPIESFGRHRLRSDGLNSQCRECCRAQKQRWQKSPSGVQWLESQKQRARTQKSAAVALLENAKRKTGCVVCGETEPCCLDFHHVDSSTKVMTVSRLAHGTHAWSDRGLVRLKQEMAKCVVVCANCHRKLHAGLIEAVQS